MISKRWFAKGIAALGLTVAMGLAAAGAVQASGGGSHWGYEGEAGPDHWGSLAPEYEACAKGVKQSPIDIKGASESDLEDIKFHYQSSKINILNNGHTVQVNYDKGSYIEINGERFNLLQFHFHTPSEHTIGGGSSDAEMHLVHKSDKGNLAVIGVMINKGHKNGAFRDVWANLPAHADGEHTVKGRHVNAASLLPAKRTYYNYSGSLTTPPCSEGVTWLVLTDGVEASGDNIEKLHHIVHTNNRPVQPLGERSLKKDTSTGKHGKH